MYLLIGSLNGLSVFLFALFPRPVITVSDGEVAPGRVVYGSRQEAGQAADGNENRVAARGRHGVTSPVQIGGGSGGKLRPAAVQGMRLADAEGMLLIDSTPTADGEDRPSAFLGWWCDARSQMLYSYTRVLDKPIDVGGALVALRRDLSIDAEAIARVGGLLIDVQDVASFDFALAYESATIAGDDYGSWQPVTLGALDELGEELGASLDDPDWSGWQRWVLDEPLPCYPDMVEQVAQEAPAVPIEPPTGPVRFEPILDFVFQVLGDCDIVRGGDTNPGGGEDCCLSTNPCCDCNCCNGRCCSRTCCGGQCCAGHCCGGNCC